jgi:hypothetical protein
MTPQLKLIDAMEIVVELARQNLAPEELEEERARQKDAINTVEDFVVNQLEEDDEDEPTDERVREALGLPPLQTPDSPHIDTVLHDIEMDVDEYDGPDVDSGRERFGSDHGL